MLVHRPLTSCMTFWLIVLLLPVIPWWCHHIIAELPGCQALHYIELSWKVRGCATTHLGRNTDSQDLLTLRWHDKHWSLCLVMWRPLDRKGKRDGVKEKVWQKGASQFCGLPLPSPPHFLFCPLVLFQPRLWEGGGALEPNGASALHQYAILCNYLM